MTTILILIVLIYTIFLNLRIRESEESLESLVEELEVSIEENKIQLYNKMMEWRKELKNEKPRRRSTKSSRKVPKA
tara:strand:- start:357 stop:584 length:228 start_codon:yes stop_codon:yes gene_type:complete